MRKFKVYVNGQPFEVIVEEAVEQTPSFPPTFVTPQVPVQAPPLSSPVPPAERQVPTVPSVVPLQPRETPVSKPKPEQEAKIEGGTSVVAPMPGSVLDVKVNVGDGVNEGAILLILEAMKMENEVTAPVSGTIKSIHVEKGSTVNTGDLIIVIE